MSESVTPENQDDLPTIEELIPRKVRGWFYVVGGVVGIAITAVAAVDSTPARIGVGVGGVVVAVTNFLARGNLSK